MTALPYTISNGNVPDADEVQGNFSYLLGLIAGGQGIKTGTIASLKAAAISAPTVPFLCVPTDLDAFLLYCGKADRGPNGDGFITLATFEAIS